MGIKVLIRKDLSEHSPGMNSWKSNFPEMKRKEKRKLKRNSSNERVNDVDEWQAKLIAGQWEEENHSSLFWNASSLAKYN